MLGHFQFIFSWMFKNIWKVLREYEPYIRCNINSATFIAEQLDSWTDTSTCASYIGSLYTTHAIIF